MRGSSGKLVKAAGSTPPIFSVNLSIIPIVQQRSELCTLDIGFSFPNLSIFSTQFSSLVH